MMGISSRDQILWVLAFEMSNDLSRNIEDTGSDSVSSFDTMYTK